MSANKPNNGKKLEEIKNRIVEIPYSESKKRIQKDSVDTEKLLKLSEKIRKNYDYSDLPIPGAS